MKINPASVNNIYKQQAKNAEHVSKQITGQGIASAKVDTISISAEGAKQNELSKMVQRIAVEVNGEISPQRLAELKAKVDCKQYNVTTEALADAILGRIFDKQN